MSNYNIQMHNYNGVGYDNLYPKTKSNMVLDGDTNLETKLKYYSNENLLDNWYFAGGGSQQGGGQFPINQRDGYLVPPGTPYYKPEEGWPYAGTTDQYYTVTKIDTAGSSYFEVDGETYFVPSSTPIVSGYITEGWSDGPHNNQKPTEDDILINNKGGYQFRLILDGEVSEENPLLFDDYAMKIPLYKWTGSEVMKRTEEELALDRQIKEAEYSKQNRILELHRLLEETDYIVIKIAEGVATKEEYEEQIRERQEWRREINELEG